jgi:hypothetical protein
LEGRFDSLRSWHTGSVAYVPLVDLRGDAPQAGADIESQERLTIELPPPPSSGTLTLSGILAIGALHVGRSARNVHLGVMPAWYHTGGPMQIGHSVVFDPAISFKVLPVCVFDAIVVVASTRFPDNPSELPSRCESRHFLVIEFPRSPPCCL